MSLILRQSTAKAVSFGPFLDKTDGVSLEIGLVSALDHASTGIFLSKNGGALTIRHASVTATTYDAYGNYIVTLDTTDTNTVGTLRMQFSEAATCLPVWQDFVVVEEAVFDAFFAASALGYVATQVVASVTGAVGSVTGLTASDVGAIKTKTDFLPSVTAGANGGVFIAGTNAATTITTALTTTFTGNLTGSVGSVTGAVGSVTGAVGSVTGLTTATISAAVWDLDATGHTTQGTFGQAIGDPIADTNSIFKAVVTDATGATVGVDVVDLKTQIGTAGAGLTAADDAVIAAIPSAATVAAAVWDLDATTHQTQGTFGQAIGDPAADANTIYGAVVTGAAGATVAADIIAVKAETATIVADTNELQTDWTNGGRLDLILDIIAADTTTDIPGLIAALNDLSATEIEDAVWDAVMANHLDAGSTGAALNGATAPTAAAVADAVWDEAIAGHVGAGSTGAALSAAGAAGDPWITPIPGAYIAGQAGYIVGTNLNATISSRASQTSVDDLPTNAELATALGTADDAVLAELAKVPKSDSNVTWNATALASMQQEATDALNAYDGPTNAELATALGTADDAILAVLGTPAGASMSVDIAAVKVDTAAIKLKTDNLPSDPADQSLIIAATDAIATAVADVPTNAELATALGDIPTAIENADALLDRNMATGADNGDATVRTVRQALRILRNKWSIAGSTLTVCKEDDTTTSWTGAMGSTPGADPVTSVDPAGP